MRDEERHTEMRLLLLKIATMNNGDVQELADFAASSFDVDDGRVIERLCTLAATIAERHAD